MTFWQFDANDDLKGDWLFPTETRFGAGRIKELPSILAANWISRPLIVTDRGLTATAIPNSSVSLAAKAATPLLWAEADQNPTGSTGRRGNRGLSRSSCRWRHRAGRRQRA